MIHPDVYKRRKREDIKFGLQLFFWLNVVPFVVLIFLMKVLDG